MKNKQNEKQVEDLFQDEPVEQRARLLEDQMHSKEDNFPVQRFFTKDELTFE